MDYIGVDLGCSAISRAPSSAVAVLDGSGQLADVPRSFRGSSELMEVISRYDRRKVIVAVDAPRSVPDHRRENYAVRSCELEIKRRIDRYAGAFAGVASLFLRWYEIESPYLRGVKVIETYPRVIWKRLSLPGKPRSFAKHRQEVWSAVKGKVGVACDGFSHHQVDALLCAYTALCYDRRDVDWFGQPG